MGISNRLDGELSPWGSGTGWKVKVIRGALPETNSPPGQHLVAPEKPSVGHLWEEQPHEDGGVARSARYVFR